ncbi:MAG: hypothetical protein QOI07_340 [Verrucomicrobiota bacterium]
MKSAGDLFSHNPGIVWPNECHRRRDQSRFGGGNRAGKLFVGEQLRQLSFDGGAELRAVHLPRHTLQDQAFDVDIDAHAMTCAPFLFSWDGKGVVSLQRSSDSLTGRSSLRNSARAAARTNDIVTLERASAAVKQALSATL